MIFFEDKVTDMADHVLLYHIIEVLIILLISELTYRLIEKPMGKISWAKTKNYFTQLFDIKRKDYLRKAEAVVAVLIFLVGSMGIIVSPTVKAENFNKSQLAERIIANRKEQSKDNKTLIAKLRKSKKKTTQKTKLVKEAT